VDQSFSHRQLYISNIVVGIFDDSDSGYQIAVVCCADNPSVRAILEEAAPSVTIEGICRAMG